jgi:hypothetical protein
VGSRSRGAGHFCRRRLPSLLMSLGILGIWSLSNVATAQAFTTPPPVQPYAPASVSGTLANTAAADGVAISEVEAGVGTGGEVCAATGVETAGVGCIAGAVIAAAAAAPVIYHLIWGSDHNSTAPACTGCIHSAAFNGGTFANKTGDVMGSTYADFFWWGSAPNTTFGSPYNENLYFDAIDAAGHDCGSAVQSTSGDTPGWSASNLLQYSAGAIPTAVATQYGGTYATGANDCTSVGHPPSRIIVSTKNSSSGLYVVVGNFLWNQSSVQTTHNLTFTEHCSDGSTLTGSTGTFNDTDVAPPNVSIPPCPSGTTPTSIVPSDSPGTGGSALDAPTWNAPTVWGTPASDPYAGCDPGGAYAPCPLYWQEVTVPNAWTVAYDDNALDWQDITDPNVTQNTLPSDTSLQSAFGSSSSKLAGPYTDTSDSTKSDYYRAVWGPYVLTVLDGAESDIQRSLTPGTTPAPSNLSDNCFPSGWSAFNPIEWVEKPVRCVLVWAFAPDSPTVQADVTGLSSTWSSSPPGVAAGVVGSFGSALTPPSSSATCDGPIFSATIPGAVHGTTPSQNLSFHPYSMCNSFGLWVHNWVIPLSSALLYLATAVLIAKILGGAIGWRPPMSSGGQSI